MIEDHPTLTHIHEAVSGVERDLVAEILASPTYPAEAVASTLRRQGFKVSASTIRTYRRELAREQVTHE